MSMILFRVSFIITSMLIAPVHAELIKPDYSDQLTLKALIDKVSSAHPSQQSVLAQHGVIDANNQLAQSLFADQIVLNVNHQNDVIVSDDGRQEWESSVDLPLWLPGQQQQQRHLSESLSAEIPVVNSAIRLASAALVRDALWKVILADSMTVQSFHLWQSAIKMRDDIVARVNVGEMATTEGLLAKTHSLEMQNNYLADQAKLIAELDNYYLLTGEKTLPSDYQEQEGDNGTVLEQHPLIAVLDQTLETLLSEQQLAQFEGKTNPNLSIGIRTERDDRNEDFNTSMGLGLSIALGNNTHQQPAIAKAGQALTDKQIERQLLERDLKVAINTTRHELISKRAQLSLLNQQDDIQQQFYLIQKRSFELGEINLFTLLQTQAQADKVANRKQLLEVEIQQAIAMLNQALGLVP
jgi:cobalt-zinc-cadmium efflux system outer membrane protein